MLKRFYLLFIPLVAFLSSVAQFQIIPMVSAVGCIQKNQLWNVSVLNQYPDTRQCRLDLIVRDRNTGLEVLTAKSGAFSAPKGMIQLNWSTLSPIRWNAVTNYMISGLGTDFLPVGQYMVCYQLNREPAMEFVLAEECIPIDVEPLSPPILQYPPDSSRLESPPNQFNWTPPMPLQLFRSIVYDVNISEIFPGQQPAEAIQENISALSKTNVASTSIPYQAGDIPLERDKWYAWQVVARDGETYAGKSEVWVFSIPTNKQAASESFNYIDITDPAGQNAVFACTGGILRVKLYSEIDHPEALLEITNQEGRVLDKVREHIRPGINFISIPLKGNIRTKSEYKLVYRQNEARTFSIKFINQ